jgi:hypothetical protein
VLQGAVGTVLVEMRRVLGQDVFKMAPVKDQYSVEQLAADVNIHLPGRGHAEIPPCLEIGG